MNIKVGDYLIYRYYIHTNIKTGILAIRIMEINGDYVYGETVVDTDSYEEDRWNVGRVGKWTHLDIERLWRKTTLDEIMVEVL